MKTTRRVISFLPIFLLSNLLFGASYFIQLKPAADQETELLKLKKRLPDAAVSRAFRLLTEQGLERVYVLETSHEMDARLIQTLMQECRLEYIEPVPVHQFFYTPNDLNAQRQWNLRKIAALQAWDLEKGGKSIVIGLIDDGMDTIHSDLRPTVWKNTGEIPGNNTDDDANGYTDDFFGWDAGDNDNDPSVVSSNGLDHGTHCAGIAGAYTDNSNGIASVGFNIRIMPVKISSVNRAGLFNVHTAIEYTIVNGADVISMSWGGFGYSRTLQTLFNVARSREIVCVAAAGNHFDSTRMYPAAYNYVISVGATDSSDRKSNFSAYGSWIDVMAPGSSIYSTLPGNGYGYKNGTSMACPLVSGLCALMLSRNGTLSAAQVETCLKNNCDNINAQNTNYTGLLGSGRINAYRSLLCVKTLNANFTSSKTYICTGDTVTFYDKSSPASQSRIWSFPGGTPSVSTQASPVVRYNTAGKYNVQLITNRNGASDTMLKSLYIEVGVPSVTFSGSTTISSGSFATIRADFTGKAPWRLIYTDGIMNDTVDNIVSTPFFLLKSPVVTTTFSPVAVRSGSCSGTVSNNCKITVVSGGSNACDSGYRFHLTFGGSGDHQIHDVAVLQDTLYYLVGKTNAPSAGNYDAFVAKIGASGRTYWHRRFGGSAEDAFLTVVVDTFQNVYCGGYTHSNVPYRAAMMVKYGSNGSIVWRSYYNDYEREYIISSVLSGDGTNVYFTGHSISNSYGSEDFTVYKMNCNTGSPTWVKQYGTTNLDRSYNIYEDDSLNLYVLGVANYSGNQDGHILKLDASGNMIFSKRYGNANTSDVQFFGSMVSWKKKALFLLTTANVGTSSRRIQLSRLNFDGTVFWTREYTYGSFGPVPSITLNGDELVVGGNTVVSSRTYSFMMRLDTNGNVLRFNRIGNGSLDYLMHNYSLCSDGSMVYAGTQNGLAMLGKTNCNLQNYCLNGSATPTVGSYTYIVTNNAFSGKNFNYQVSPTHSTFNQNKPLTYTCRSVYIPQRFCKLNADFSIVSACTGDTVIFTDRSNDGNAYPINSRIWETGDGKGTGGSIELRHRYTAKGQYPVKLIVISSSNGHVCADTIVKIYNSSDSVSIPYMPVDTTVCQRDSIRVAAPSVYCGKAPYTYRWSPAAGVSDTTSAQPWFTPKVTTDYTVRVRDANGMTAMGTFRITVNNSCCISYADFETDKADLCPGDTVRFKNLSKYDAGSASFIWEFSGPGATTTYNGFEPPYFVPPAAGNWKVRLMLFDICTNDTIDYLIRSLEPPHAFAGTDSNLCSPGDVQLGETALGMNRYKWTPATGLNNPDIADPVATIDDDRTYIVEVSNEYGCVAKDTVELRYIRGKIFISSDTSVCAGDSITLTIPGSGQYLWNTGQTTATIRVSSPGLYWGELKDICTFRDTVILSLLPAVDFDLGRDTSVCAGETIQIGTGLSGTYSWNTGQNTAMIQVGTAGLYILTVTGNNGCTGSDSLNLAVDPLPVFSLGADKVICLDSLTIIPNPLHPGAVYLWNNGSNNTSLRIKTPGTYSLLLTSDKGCRYSDTVVMTSGLLPFIDLPDKFNKCIGTNLVVTLPSVNGQFYRWYDQTSGLSKVFTQEGTYWVEANTICGDSMKTFSVNDSDCQCEVWVPNAFTPGGDGLNESFHIVSQCHLINYSMRIYTRWGELLFSSFDPLAEWNGTYKGEKVPPGVYIYIIEFQKDMPTLKEYNILKGPLSIQY